MTDIAANVHAVLTRIEAACARAGRDPRDVTLVAVSKRHSVAAVEAAYTCGVRVFGENYAQELLEKAAQLAHHPDIEWHMIGHLQRNKAKPLVRMRATIDTVGSPRLAIALGQHAADAMIELPVLVQVNIAAEEQKSGCSIDALPEVIDAVRAEPALRLEGLMTIAAYGDDPETARPTFARLRELVGNHGLRHASMGMTADLDVAIEEGATMVRIGTAIFGDRSG